MRIDGIQPSVISALEGLAAKCTVKTLRMAAKKLRKISDELERGGVDSWRVANIRIQANHLDQLANRKVMH